MLTQTELKSLLHYEPETGIFTRVKAWRCVNVGDIAGYKRTDGYIYISVNRKQYQSHRLAWLYVYGTFPAEFIDHINMARDDNRIINLRDATNQQNQMNRGVQKNNTSGYKGVCFNKRDNKWQASAGLNGKLRNLGSFYTAELASEAYKTFARLNHGEFLHESLNGYGDMA